MPLSVAHILQQLIRIPSVNPLDDESGFMPGQAEPSELWLASSAGKGGAIAVTTPKDTFDNAINAPDSIFGEGRLSNHLQAICEELQLGWCRQEVHAGRDNLITCLEGDPPANRGGQLILWEVHQDTVAIDGMTIDPFGGEMRDGRLYGRGAADVKGGMAAMIVALSRLVKERPAGRPTIVLAFTVNEEYGFTGAKALSGLWPRGDRSSIDGSLDSTGRGIISPAELFPRPPDAAIVAEPTDLNIVVAHKGFVRWRCHTIGKAAHTSQPDRGANAIYAMARVVRAIERYAKEVAPRLPSHPLCGPATVSVTMMIAGREMNTVPERATVTIDRRLSPDEDPGVAYQALVDYVASHVGASDCQIVHDPPVRDSIGLSDRRNRDVAQQLATVVQSVHSACQLVGAPYGTDAAVIGASGVPTIVFGPGCINQAHTADEWIDVEQLERAAEILYQIGGKALA